MIIALPVVQPIAFCLSAIQLRQTITTLKDTAAGGELLLN